MMHWEKEVNSLLTAWRETTTLYLKQLMGKLNVFAYILNFRQISNYYN